MSGLRRRTFLSFLFVLLIAAPRADAATLARGMAQLVHLYESANVEKLNSALRLHLTTAKGDPMVHIRIDPNAKATDVIERLTAVGFRLVAVSEMDSTLLEGSLPLASARAAAGVSGVLRVLAVQRPLAFKGSVQSQAVAVQKADAAHARGIDGTGTRVGILSDSFASIAEDPADPNVNITAADDVATGDLPPDVTVLEDLPPNEGSDEGRAMAQLVYDVAPGAKLGFATAFKGLVDFSNNILRLRREFHADVITDDVIYFAEPMYSDGLLAQTVDQVVREGAAYFSSAGNNGLEAYEATFDAVSLKKARKLVKDGKENLDLDALSAKGFPAESFHNFMNRDGSVTISQRLTSYFGDVIVFQWDEPFDLGKVKTDYNIYVFDQDGHFLDPNDPNGDVFFTSDDNVESDEAVELLTVSPGTYQIVIAKVNDGPARRLKYVVLNGTGESPRQNAPSVWGHAAARRGQAVAAMFYPILRFPEDYSSPGPVTILFDRGGSRLDEPEVRRVPQITGVDGVDNTFFGGDIEPNGFPNFFGTSAAAPDVAAVAALVIQAAGGPGKMDPDDIYDQLQKTATPIPLARNRTLAVAFAGALAAAANGDFPRETDYWQLAVLPVTRATVNQVTINLTSPNMRFSDPLNPRTGFHIGTTHGLSASDVIVTRSADRTSLTLTFTPGTFGAGDFLTFANFAFPTLLPVQFQVDADRVEGGEVTVSFSDGSTKTGTFAVDRKVRRNNFTGAGLVNADAATRERSGNDTNNDNNGRHGNQGRNGRNDRRERK